MASNGRDGFHHGEIADKLVSSVKANGGIVLASIFNMLDELGYAQASEDQQIHMVVEAMRRAYRDRAECLGDIDYVDIPDELTSQQYAKKLLENFSSQHATPSSTLGKIADDAAGTDTTHFSIIDAEGNMVSATLSVNYPFGSGLIADGTGV